MNQLPKPSQKSKQRRLVLSLPEDYRVGNFTRKVINYFFMKIIISLWVIIACDSAIFFLLCHASQIIIIMVCDTLEKNKILWKVYRKTPIILKADNSLSALMLSYVLFFKFHQVSFKHFNLVKFPLFLSLLYITLNNVYLLEHGVWGWPLCNGDWAPAISYSRLWRSLLNSLYFAWRLIPV